MLFKGRKFSTNKVLLNKRQFIHDDGFAIVNEFDKMRLRADKRNNRLLASIDKKNFDQQVDYQRSRTDLESDIMPDYFDKNRTDADLANDEFANRNQLITNCLKIFKGNEIKANELMQALLTTGLDGFFNKFITRIIRMVYENFGSKPKIQDVIDLVTFLEANQNSPNFWNMAQTGPAGPQGQQGLPGQQGPAGPQGRPPTPQNPRVPTPQGQPPTPPPFVPINQPPRVPTPQGPIIQPTPRGPTPPTPRGPTPPTQTPRGPPTPQPPTPPAAQPPTPPGQPPGTPPVQSNIALPTLPDPNDPSRPSVIYPFELPNSYAKLLLPLPDNVLEILDFSFAAIPDGDTISQIIRQSGSRQVFTNILTQRYKYRRSITSRATDLELSDFVQDELVNKELMGGAPPPPAQPTHQDIAALGSTLADQDPHIFDMIELYVNNNPLKKHMVEILTIRYGDDKTRTNNLIRRDVLRRVKQKVHEERVQRNALLFALLRGGTP